MNFSLIYLVSRFFFRLSDFFHHWYIDGSRRIAHWGLSVFERFDRVIAFRITLRHFSKPLYRDYSIVGRILGVIFRSARLCVGVGMYIPLGLLWAGVYLLWIAIPFVILLLAYQGFSETLR